MEEVNKLNSEQMDSKTTVRKLTYDQLEEVCHQMQQRLAQCYDELKNRDLDNTIIRLNLLFRVIENASHFSKEFVTSCITEIEQLMTLPDDEQKEMK
jgi:hypothetical protein